MAGHPRLVALSALTCLLAACLSPAPETRAATPAFPTEAGPGLGAHGWRPAVPPEDESRIPKARLVSGPVTLDAWLVEGGILRLRAVVTGKQAQPLPFHLLLPATGERPVPIAGGWSLGGFTLATNRTGFRCLRDGRFLFGASYTIEGDTLVETRRYRDPDQEPEFLYGGGHSSPAVLRSGEELDIYHEAFYGRFTKMAIPVVYSSAGDGTLFNAHGRDRLRFGGDGEGVTVFRTRQALIDQYAFSGADPKDAVRLFYKLSGSRSLLPRWAYGFIQSKYGYRNQREALAIAAEFRRRRIPLSALVLDLYWFKTMGDLEWDAAAWPDPAGMARRLAADGVKLVVITEPYVLRASKNFQRWHEAGILALNSTGEPARADIWLGPAALFNPLATNALPVLGGRYVELVRQGVAGFWSDLGEPEKDAEGARFAGYPMQQFHNFYNHEWARLVHEALAFKFPDLRLFNLSRSGYVGTAGFGVSHWSGDVACTPEALAEQTGLAINDALAGYSYWGSDVGGFTGRPSAELFVRWYQFGAFTPVFRAHGNKEREPWRFVDAAQYEMIVKYIRLRHRLLPYVYSTAWQTCRDGIPMLRPLFLEFPQDRSLWTGNRQALQDQFLFGDAFLVAPLVDEGTARRVWLPPGRWYNFHDGKPVPSGALQASLPSGDLPVYVRGGAIIPWDEDMDGTVDALRLYAGEGESTFTWYEDDGISNDFRKGKHEAIGIRLDVGGVSFEGVKTARRLKLVHITPDGERVYSIELPAGQSRTVF